ncbi:MAG: hypothetical protein ACKOLA_10765 [Spartobacteria bacterium]
MSIQIREPLRQKTAEPQTWQERKASPQKPAFPHRLRDIAIRAAVFPLAIDQIPAVPLIQRGSMTPRAILPVDFSNQP